MDTSVNSDVELIPKIGSSNLSQKGKYRDENEVIIKSGSLTTQNEIKQDTPQDLNTVSDNLQDLQNYNLEPHIDVKSV